MRVSAQLLLLLTLLLLVFSLQLAAALRVRHTIEKLVHRIATAFEQEGVEYWVDFGTLLGITREGRVIMGDNDADLCILDAPQNHEKVQRVVRQMGGGWLDWGNWLDWGAYRVYGDLGTVHIDIYVVRDEEMSFKTPTGESVDKALILPVRKRRVDLGGRGIVLSLPTDVHGVLESRYGKNWRQPRRSWPTLYFDFQEKEWWKKDWWRLSCLAIAVAFAVLLHACLRILQRGTEE